MITVEKLIQEVLKLDAACAVCLEMNSILTSTRDDHYRTSAPRLARIVQVLHRALVDIGPGYAITHLEGYDKKGNPIIRKEYVATPQTEAGIRALAEAERIAKGSVE